MRAFDPRRVGWLECDVWVAYYQRDWWRLVRAYVPLVREGFGMSWRQTLAGAWLVARANRAWAPYPRNDPERTRRLMRRFFALVAAAHGQDFDVDEAARREVHWWAVHRRIQKERPLDGIGPLVDALTDLYTLVYDADDAEVRPAARLRAEAMQLSDRWVEEGCDPASPLIAREAALLVRSYASLLAVVHAPPTRQPDTL